MLRVLLDWRVYGRDGTSVHPFGGFVDVFDVRRRIPGRRGRDLGIQGVRRGKQVRTMPTWSARHRLTVTLVEVVDTRPLPLSHRTTAR
jgi:hypothetical protein